MSEIISFAISVDEPLDLEKTKKWLDDLFRVHGSHILRGKGFMNISEEPLRYEFQAVRKTFHLEANDSWPDGEERKTVLVLIGTELPDQKETEAALRTCIA